MTSIRVYHSRRDWFRILGLGAAGLSSSGWLDALAADASAQPSRKRSLIVLWLNGGPSTIDLWDLKPGQANGGPYREIDSAVPGLRISEHLPQLAARARHLALVRSMATKEGDHSRATFVAHTGVPPQGAIRFPTLGSLVAKELGQSGAELPSTVCIAPRRNSDLDAHSAGFLGVEFAPLLIGENADYDPANADPDRILRVANLPRAAGVDEQGLASRIELLRRADAEFAQTRPGAGVEGHRASLDRAVRMMQQRASTTFDLSSEPAEVRDRYGRTLFGQGCLLARRLVEREVPFVEVTLDGWDTHQNNFERVAELSRHLDTAWSALIDDLESRGLLERTMILCLGEFGRTPKINGTVGRDHFPAAWSVAMTGGGIRGGTVVGRTSPDGTTVEDRPVTIPDLLTTVCTAIGIDPLKQNLSNVDRPIRIVDKSARPIVELL